MKKNTRLILLFLISSLLCSSISFAQTTLTDGDIAFTRISGDNPDGFSFVCLTDIASSTTIYFSNEYWNGSSFTSEYFTFLFTATSNISSGDEVHIDTDALSINSTSGNVTGTFVLQYSSNPANFIHAQGDNIMAFQGSIASPTFIAAITSQQGEAGTSGNAWQTTSSVNNTKLPNGKTNGQNGYLGLFPNGGTESDNARYKSTALHTGDKATVLAAIMNLSNWEFNNDNVFAPSSTAFSIASSAPSEAEVAATVFLEGAYNGTGMNTTLNSSIPTSQPYSFNGHSGGSASSIPANAVDWVLVELREAGSATAALDATKVGSAAGFLMSDGTIKATDGSSNLTISLSGNSGSEFYVVIYHRNHLPIMSASAISESGGTYSIDFTSNAANTHETTNALTSLTGGKFGMPAGDTDGDGDIDATDLGTWRSSNGAVFSYDGNGASDFNLDGVINAVDRNDFHQKNTSKTRKVPGS